jgi:hypothetical protein
MTGQEYFLVRLSLLSTNTTDPNIDFKFFSHFYNYNESDFERGKAVDA